MICFFEASDTVNMVIAEQPVVLHLNERDKSKTDETVSQNWISLSALIKSLFSKG